MAYKKIDFMTVRQLHKDGDFHLAKKGYLDILKSNPADIDVLHYLAILCTQQENFDEAISHFKKAIFYKPKDAALYLHLANVYKLKGAYLEAIELLEKMMKSFPDYTPIFNNLGSAHFAAGDLDKAIYNYRLAIAKMPDYIDSYYNLALAFNKKNAVKDAIENFKKVIQLAPKHIAAHFHLACIYMRQNELATALKEFLIVEAIQPFHFETQTNLATCYLKLANYNEAKIHYLKAFELDATDTQILYNLGFIFTQLGNLDIAIQYYQRAINIDPDLFFAHNNLGVAFLNKGFIEYALQHFRQALRIQPHNQSIAYIVESLAQNKLLNTAPADYIRSLFDAYADHYESHLLEALDYKIPQIFYNMMQPLIKNSRRDILDLGCGTGLCGVPFKPYANSLTGVDLSAKMLEQAQNKNIYTHLHLADLTDYLANKINQFDIILAGDVLVYIGDLAAFFMGITQALRPNGYVIFNTEISETQDYNMNQSGRFAHNRFYINNLAKQNLLTEISYLKCVTRLQNNEAVNGYVYIYYKKIL